MGAAQRQRYSPTVAPLSQRGAAAGGVVAAGCHLLMVPASLTVGTALGALLLLGGLCLVGVAALLWYADDRRLWAACFGLALATTVVALVGRTAPAAARSAFFDVLTIVTVIAATTVGACTLARARR